ncbi:hypothetical protein AB0G15_05860 [Streptosporangium sp. NPDC023825]|uniref:hypothetical protein n=1 Tax=Streptosporangium sp. NPDC023825 TaxID=3154909 RepID=UPI003427EE72
MDTDETLFRTFILDSRGNAIRETGYASFDVNEEIFQGILNEYGRELTLGELEGWFSPNWDWFEVSLGPGLWVMVSSQYC